MAFALSGCGSSTPASATPSPAPAPALASVVVSPATATVLSAATQQLTAQGKYSDGSTANVSSSVTWSSSNTAIATVNGTGLVTGVSAGTATLTASLSGISATAQITVAAPAKTLSSISIAAVGASVAAGATQQLAATATYSDGSSAIVTTSVSWSSSNSAVATVSASGLVTGVSAGTASVTASLSGVSATVQITVPPPVKTLSSISVAPLITSVVSGSTQQLTATATYSDGSTTNVTSSASWTSSKTAVATVNASGLVTGASAGTAVVTAAYNGLTATSTVTVTPPPAPTVQFSASPATIVRGNASTLSWTTTDATGFNIDNGVGTKPVNGSIQVSPATTTTYTATATGAGGTTTAQATVTANPSPGGSAVLMHKNDLAGDGANLNEVVLTTTNVNFNTFGKKFAIPVDGQIYAQPLYVPGLMINGTAHNTAFVATQNDTVYAVDSDNGARLWKVSLGTAVPNNDPEGVQPTLGILSTPVIDPNTNTMYVTAVTTGTVLTLHALDITTGAEKLGGPVNVTASVAGTGNGSVNGMVPLSKGCYQRTALTLTSGQVYLGFGHCNHGWVLAYDATTLAQTHALNTSPDGIGATLWMGGAAPVVDSSGDLYVITADDIGTTAPAANDFPDAFLKLSPSLTVLDSFIPSNERYLESNDADLGSGAPIVMPDNTSAHPHEVIGGGKDGRVFVVDRDSMGGYNAGGTDGNVQTIQTGTQQFDNIWGAPAFFNGHVFFHTENDVLRSYPWSAAGSLGLLTSNSASANAVYLNHGASPSISANGTSEGIVWDVDNSGYPSSGGSGGTPAILHAYDANSNGNVIQELYNSSQAPNGRDTAGHACKFSIPTVTNGEVFVPTCTELDIYGILP